MLCRRCRTPVEYPGLDHSFCPSCADWVQAVLDKPKPDQVKLKPVEVKSKPPLKPALQKQEQLKFL